jgi:hypothetical protein
MNFAICGGGFSVNFKVKFLCVPVDKNSSIFFLCGFKLKIRTK